MRSAQQTEFGGAPKLSLNELVIGHVLQNMAVVALFITPMLTMRLFAEEKRQGTLELLATAPITGMQIVLGKFLGALSLFALMIAAGLLNFAAPLAVRHGAAGMEAGGHGRPGPPAPRRVLHRRRPLRLHPDPRTRSWPAR